MIIHPVTFKLVRFAASNMSLIFCTPEVSKFDTSRLVKLEAPLNIPLIEMRLDVSNEDRSIEARLDAL